MCRAYVSGGSLVATFEFVLPSEFQKASQKGCMIGQLGCHQAPGVCRVVPPCVCIVIGNPRSVPRWLIHVLPQAAIRAGKIPRSPGQDISGTNPAGVTFLLAFGDVNSQRQLQVGTGLGTG